MQPKKISSDIKIELFSAFKKASNKNTSSFTIKTRSKSDFFKTRQHEIFIDNLEEKRWEEQGPLIAYHNTNRGSELETEIIIENEKDSASFFITISPKGASYKVDSPFTLLPDISLSYPHPGQNYLPKNSQRIDIGASFGLTICLACWLSPAPD